MSILERDIKDFSESTLKKVQTLTDKIVDYASYLDADRKSHDLAYESHLRELTAIQQVIEDKL